MNVELLNIMIKDFIKKVYPEIEYNSLMDYLSEILRAFDKNEHTKRRIMYGKYNIVYFESRRNTI
jgi:hypothetical protein